MNNLEICVDASMKNLDNRTFGCSGAYCINNNMEKYIISPDSTNNRSELLAIYIGIKLAHSIINQFPNTYDGIIIYSDSKFSVYGLTKWIHHWVATQDGYGIFYGTNGAPVANQELFKAIITYCVTNNIIVKLYHQKGHVKYTSVKNLNNANQIFLKSNGFYLKPEDIYKISYYNDIIDNKTRNKLNRINPNDYPILNYNIGTKEMVRYMIPNNFYQFIS